MRPKFSFLSLLLALGAGLAACTDAPRPETATALYFLEREPDMGPFSTRMIVTPRFLRIDDGTRGKDFILFDRQEKVISSVSVADTRILVIQPKPVEIAPPVKLRHQVIQDPSSFPNVGGSKVTRYRLLTNGKQCYDLYAAQDLLQDVVQALREFREALAGEQALVVPFMPKEMQTGCDLANNVFLPARHLAHGLPVRYTDMTGRTSELTDYKTDFQADPVLFELPENYRQISIEDMRGGV